MSQNFQPSFCLGSGIDPGLAIPAAGQIYNTQESKPNLWIVHGITEIAIRRLHSSTDLAMAPIDFTSGPFDAWVGMIEKGKCLSLSLC